MANHAAVATVIDLLTTRGETSTNDWLAPYRGCLLHGSSAGSGKSETIKEIRRICKQDPTLAVFEIVSGDMHLYQTGELEYEILRFCKHQSSEASTSVLFADDIDMWFDYKSVQSMLLSVISESEAGSLFIICSSSDLEKVPAPLLLPGDSMLIKVDLPLPGREERAALLRDLLVDIPLDTPIDILIDDLVAMTQVGLFTL